MIDDPGARLRFRQAVQDQFGPVQVAISPDGRNVHLTAAIDSGLGAGRFAVVLAPEDSDTPNLVIQVHESHLVQR